MDRTTAGTLHRLHAKLTAIVKEMRTYQRRSTASVNPNDRRYYRDLAEAGKRKAEKLELQIKKLQEQRLPHPSI